MIDLNKNQKSIPPPSSYLSQVWREFWRSRLNRLGLVLTLWMMGVAFFAPLLANSEPLFAQVEGKIYFPFLTKIFPFKYGVEYPDLSLENLKNPEWAKKEGALLLWAPIPYSPSEYDLEAILEAPSRHHYLGTDEQGRDIASRMIYGSRISLSVGFVAVSLYTLIGIFLGAWAGYFGGKWDLLISRLIEIMVCFPTFFLILTVLAFVGPSIFNIMIVIGLTGWTGIARLVRGEFLKLRNLDYVAAAKIQGASTWRLLFRHLLPNALSPVLVSATFGVASAILVESSLSFLGFGVQPPTPSWGDILSQSRDFMDIAWWLTLFPGLAIFITITSYNLVGEGLRDALDPRLKGS